MLAFLVSTVKVSLILLNVSMIIYVKYYITLIPNQIMIEGNSL